MSYAAKYEPWPDKVDAKKLLAAIVIRIDKEALIEEISDSSVRSGSCSAGSIPK